MIFLTCGASMQKGGVMEDRELVGDTVVLKLLKYQYIQTYLHMFSATVCGLLHVDDLASEYDYLQHIIDKQQGKTLFYCIFLKVVDQLIGGLAIRDSRVFASQLYCWLNEQFWGRGYLQEAMPLAMNAYFSFFNESYVRANVDIDNMRSYYALKKCGFVDFGMSKGPRGKQYILIFRRK